jgi:hypothetical protein
MKLLTGKTTSRAGWLSASIVIASVLSGSLLAAQGNQRRVFTNDDVAPPPPPAATAPSDTPAAPVSPSATPAAARPTAATGTPLADLNRAVTVQATLMDLFGEFNGKALEASDAATKKRWTDMSVCISAVMQANQRNIEELQQQVPQEQWPKDLTSALGAEATPQPVQ